MDNFAPVKDIREVPFWKDNRQRRAYFPPVGSVAFVVYVETKAKETAVRKALTDLAKLADKSEQLEWHPSAEEGRDPSIVLHVIALKHARKPKE